MARIKALLRRVEFDTARTAQNERIEFADILIDLNRRQIFKGGKEVALRFKEFELLSLLLLKAGDVVTRAEIFDKVWGTKTGSAICARSTSISAGYAKNWKTTQ